jgi:hypothetical protein
LTCRAVLGNTIRLSDVQLTDCRSVLSLFNDVNFRRFLETFPDFLSLRSRVATKFEKVKSPALAAILSGLERARGDDWVSSTFKNVEMVKDVAKQFESSSYEQDAADVCKKRLQEEKDDLVKGLLYGVHHFCGFPQQVTPCTDSGSSFDVVLDKAEALLTRESMSPDKVQATLQYIKKHGKSGERHKRTPAVLKLHDAGLKNPANRVVYFNIIQAWNIGVSNTLHADRDEAPAFEIVDPLPLMFGEFREATLEANATLGDHEFLQEVYASNWHPAQLTWEVIRRIRKDEKCRACISNYQYKLGAGEPIREEFRSLTEAIANALAKERLAPVENVTQIAAVGKDIGNYVSWLGNFIAAAHPKVGLFCLIGEKVAKAAQPSFKVALGKLRSQYRSEIASGLKDYAIRYNLHRWTDIGEVG